MKYSFSYDKRKVIQGLRFHFISRTEIRILVILINLFAIVSGLLFFFKKITPQPFLLSSVMWLLLMITFWFILPNTIYRRNVTFKESFTIFFHEQYVRLENVRGYVDWQWKQFTTFYESPNFFHIYFSSKSFFLLPKDEMTPDFAHDLRAILNRKIKGKV